MTSRESRLNILWFLALDPRYDTRHGGNLRYVNLSKGLRALGHHVYYLVTNHLHEDRSARNRFLDTLRGEGVLTDYFEIEACSRPTLGVKLARLLLHPRVEDWVMSSTRMRYKTQAFGLLDRYHIDLCVLSDRYGLFLLPELARRAPTIVDWCDSFVLAGLRDLRVRLGNCQVDQVPAVLKELASQFTNERVYGRYSSANIVVSPVDKRYLDAINRRPLANHVLLNGVRFNVGDDIETPKIPSRLIFTGTMSFPPNYQAALWFIKRVMPLLEQQRSDIYLVVAGQEPNRELRAAARRNVVVTGFAPDLRQEIAKSQLYVAPLISGCGFKNKIIEALAAGTFVAATSIAVESLGEQLRSLLLVADGHRELANRILQYLDAPEKFNTRLTEARQIVKTEFTWEGRVEQLLDVYREVTGQASLGRRSTRSSNVSH
jgi:glycosyltransferase involved in cell wall biosynthesis